MKVSQCSQKKEFCTYLCKGCIQFHSRTNENKDNMLQFLIFGKLALMDHERVLYHKITDMLEKIAA